MNNKPIKTFCQKCTSDGNAYFAIINLYPVGTSFICKKCFKLFKSGVN